MPSREFLVPQSIRLLEGEPMDTKWRDSLVNLFHDI